MSLLEKIDSPGDILIHGKSITDPCLGWDDSEKLIYSIYDLC